MSNILKISLLLLFASSVPNAWCEGSSYRSAKTFGLSFVAGAPQLLGGELSFLKLSPVTFGMSYGTAPVQKYLGSQVNIDPIDLGTVPGIGTMKAVPSVNFSIGSFLGFLRYFPGDGIFFLQSSYSSLHFTASVNADIVNETTSKKLSNVISGSLSITQPMANLMLGIELGAPFGLFFDFGIGAAYLLKTRTSLNIGGKAAEIAVLIPEADAAVDKAKAKLQSQIDTKVDEFRGKIRFVPNAFLNLGWAF